MSIRVNYNVSAILANDYLRKADDALTESTGRLSSGFKINRAGDNPTGMAIGRRMRAQIRGLSQASDNASDAINVIQTAEGAMNEIHDMLQRMNELSIKAANGTLSGDEADFDENKAQNGYISTTNSQLSDTDRALIQEEIDQLLQEIERVASTTEFNGRKLLDGTFDLKGYVEKPDAGGKISAAAANLSETDLGLAPGATPAEIQAAQETKTQTVLDALSSAFHIETYSDETNIGIYDLKVTLGEKYEYTYTDNYDYSDPDHPEGIYVDTTFEKQLKGYTIAGLSVVNHDTGDTYDFHNMEMDYISITGQKNAYIDNDRRTATLKADNGFSLTVDMDWSKLTELVSNDDYDENDPKSSPTKLVLKEEYAGLIQSDYDADSPMYDINVLRNTGDSKALVDEDGKSLNDDYITAFLAAYNTNVKPAADPDLTETDLKAMDDDTITALVKDVKAAAADDCSYNFIANLTDKGAMTELIGAEQGTVLDIRIPKVSAKNLGIQNLSVMTQDKARESIDRVSRAIERLSASRSRLGAYQNRLEHSINSLDAAEESVTASMSQIMDTNMAEEMTIYSQQQVMSQAGTSILAQANQRPSQLLQLLQ